MSLPISSCRLRVALGAVAFAVAVLTFSSALVAAEVGSANVVSADPPVPRPATKPCVVTLLDGQSFTDFSAKPFTYKPPESCSGAWSKVVLEADFSVSAGRQFDRTASLWLGGVNLYFGTTQEPSAVVSPSWHVERDLTDYSSLLRASHDGQAILGNVVDSTYTGIIRGSARLLFYPANLLAPPAEVPDAVYPLASAPGSTTDLDDSSARLSRDLALPRNVLRAYLDVFAQSQGNDEFWYTCVPDAFSDELQSCGGGSFREVEVDIDGQPAGLAPVYPWIYTGGIDPYMWRPAPGVRTLNFLPYRVDLTPFAGVLSDGASHQVAVGVIGANNHFSVSATLLVYRDKIRSVVSGALTRNSLASVRAPAEVQNTLVEDSSGGVKGGLKTVAQRQYVIEGYVDGSHGRVSTEVEQRIDFSNQQSYNINTDTYRQVIDQRTQAIRHSRTRRGALLLSDYQERLDYPLRVVYDQEPTADKGVSVTTEVRQGYASDSSKRLQGIPLYASKLENGIDTADTLHYDSAGSYVSHDGQHSLQRYAYGDSLGGCYRVAIDTSAGVLAAYKPAEGCPAGQNRVYWFAHPDGSPDGLAWTPAI